MKRDTSPLRLIDSIQLLFQEYNINVKRGWLLITEHQTVGAIEHLHLLSPVIRQVNDYTV